MDRTQVHQRQAERDVRLCRFFLGLALSFFVPSSVNAMKPAPFEDIHIKAVQGRFELVSHQGSFLRKKRTEVRGPHSKVLWQMPEFLGRHRWELSPDGRTLITFGDYHWGDRIQLKPGAVVFTAYELGQKVKSATLGELIPENLDAWAKTRKLDVLGGQWLLFEQGMPKLSIQWEDRLILISVAGGAARPFPF